MLQCHRRRQPLDPWTKDPKEPIELLARLAGRCTQIMPNMGGKGEPLPDSELAAALGMMPDKFAATLALAVVSQDRQLIGRVVQLGFAAAVDAMQNARGPQIIKHAGADAHRLRMILVDVVGDLISPESKQPAAAMARASRMRKGQYLAAYRVVAAMVEERLSDAAKAFGKQLRRA